MILNDFQKHPYNQDDLYSVWNIRKGWIEESMGVELTVEDFKLLCDEYDMNGDGGMITEQFQSLYEILVESGEIKTKPKGDK